jgi:hypothetical protein
MLDRVDIIRLLVVGNSAHQKLELHLLLWCIKGRHTMYNVM